MTPERWIAGQIRDKGIKQSFVVDKAGIPGFTRQKLSAVCTGRRHLTVSEFIAVCRTIGANPLEYPLQMQEGESERAGA